MEKNEYIYNLSLKLEDSNLNETHKEKIMSYAQKLCDKDMPVLFDQEHIKIIFNIKNLWYTSTRYTEFFIDGENKKRPIAAPSKKLKSIQKWILKNILEKLDTSEYAYGFRKGRSILHNALCHLGNQNVLCMDIEDFFGSVTENTVFTLFKQIGYTPEASETLKDSCCYQEALPQGAPTIKFYLKIL